MYRTIVVDPPWPTKRAWGGRKARQSAADAYSLMTMDEIMAMKISRLVHPKGSHLWLWCTQSQANRDSRLILEWAPEVARSWGFEVKNVLTWGKTQPGVGAHFQVNSEFLVYAIARDADDYVPMTKRDGSVRPTWFEAPRTGTHSEKPEEAYSYIERLSYAPRIDVFARSARDGWDVWGDQAPNAVEIEL